MKDMEQFRTEALELIEQHLERKDDDGRATWGVGSDDVSIFPEHSADVEAAELARAKQWQATKFDHGFGWLTGPREYGGAELTQEHASAFNEIEDQFDRPERVFFSIGHGMIGPTTLREGTPEAKARYLRAIYRGDLLGCQLFSEPEAGSDLASVRTSAVRDGDEWVVTGQKVWTSGAHHSDVGLLLARTNPDAPKHHGMTMFLLDMHAPGVDVRPLRQMTGGAHFNEVFLDGARISDAFRLGPVDEGWCVAMETLSGERTSMRPGGANASLGVIGQAQLESLLSHMAGVSDPDVRQRLAQWYITQRIFGFNAERLLEYDTPSGPSICKLCNTFVTRDTDELVSAALGPRLVADTGEWGTFAWSAYVLGVPAMRLGGGTDEIQRNLLAERVLGLPRG